MSKRTPGTYSGPRRMKVVYICHPLRGDIAGNRERVRLICTAVKHHCVPLAPHLLLPDYIDEASERDLALKHGLALLRCADEMWICSDDVSGGMGGEIAEALRLGVSIYRIDTGALLTSGKLNAKHKEPFHYNEKRSCSPDRELGRENTQ
jgi:hypothetical protein